MSPNSIDYDESFIYDQKNEQDPGTIGLEDGQVTEYIRRGGNYCPYCYSNDLTSDCVDTYDMGEDWLTECRDCGRKWKDTYILILSAMEELEDEDGDNAEAN